MIDRKGQLWRLRPEELRSDMTRDPHRRQRVIGRPEPSLQIPGRSGWPCGSSAFVALDPHMIKQFDAGYIRYQWNATIVHIVPTPAPPGGFNWIGRTSLTENSVFDYHLATWNYCIIWSVEALRNSLTYWHHNSYILGVGDAQLKKFQGSNEQKGPWSVRL